MDAVLWVSKYTDGHIHNGDCHNPVSYGVCDGEGVHL